MNIRKFELVELRTNLVEWLNTFAKFIFIILIANIQIFLTACAKNEDRPSVKVMVVDEELISAE